MNVITSDRIIMISKLKKILTNDGVELIMSVLDHNKVLCGGLVLQTILGEEWKTDIDIFTTDRVLTSIGPIPFKEMKKESEYLVVPGVFKVYHGTICGKVHDTINGQTNNTVEDIGIDIIHISSLDDVFAGFDFDFCKVWFDGYNFHMKAPNSVLDKVCTVDEDSVTLRKAETRIPKYESRGFTIKRMKILNDT